MLQYDHMEFAKDIKDTKPEEEDVEAKAAIDNVNETSTNDNELTTEPNSEAATVELPSSEGGEKESVVISSPMAVLGYPSSETDRARLARQAKKKSKAFKAKSSRGVNQLPRMDGQADSDSVRLAASIALKELEEPDEPVILMDLSRLAQRLSLWRRHLPRVVPHYAIKCNPDRRLLRRLRESGCCFDCATMEEVQRVLSLGAKPEDVVWSHPCKLRSHLRYVRTKNVNLMSFDNDTELTKVATEFPDARLLMRLVCEDSTAQCPMSLKFGAQREEWRTLLALAQKLGLCVAGVSFHVGSGCKEPMSFQRALSDASEVFAMAKEYGFELDVLDIGGGFPGEQLPGAVTFAELARVISEQLERYFAAERYPALRVIAEPGRFLACTVASLLTKVFAKAEVSASTPALPSKPGEQDEETPTEEPEAPVFRYYLNDGLYGSFNCLLYDHAVVKPETLPTPSAEAPSGPDRQCCLFGPTCDGFDVVMKEHYMPELNEGAWLLWRNMGAYTSAAGSKFNGFPTAKVWYYEGGTLATLKEHEESDWNNADR